MDVDRMLNLEVIFQVAFQFSQFYDEICWFSNRDGLVLKTQISVTLKERYITLYIVCRGSCLWFNLV